MKQTLSPQPLKSNRNETRQSDEHGHFPSRFLADSDKTTPTHRILSWCKGWNLRVQIHKWIWSTPDKAFVLGTIAITWHSVYIPDLNWGDSPVSSCCCRSFFKTVDKQRSESMSAVPRCPLINIIETCQHLLWDVNQFFTSGFASVRRRKSVTVTLAETGRVSKKWKYYQPTLSFKFPWNIQHDGLGQSSLTLRFQLDK